MLSSVASSAKPWTCAPIRLSQQASHAPLKPVCPVSRTLRPLQKPASNFNGNV